ncbi:hypothetical protein BO70DRAFT_428847 [Aspergillus heteromorphus CBS 117.55]|uniref:Uncharacterized protein n=1 Tax=Aspergillus heteromorphus CBS 117.55 TaxID=1448321 RepID=A0A317WBK4_9EURO|nr:uncharacterized protein BO70DRAFT_428847 [Aspergillus heteromorphus CBS 117.55]PWY83579.1 hypothetical protein BO70DRAFT_428847 [Aspergillus heteromorphus CBS 117.55]
MSELETLQSILFSGPWIWDSNEHSQIEFNDNGTGTLICRQELNVWIAAEFDWKLPSSEVLQQVFNSHTTSRKPQVITEFDIEMTLTKRRIPGRELPHYRINECLLTEKAFEPKMYTVRIEKGVLLTQSDRMYAVSTRDSRRFTLRLVLDKSPFPPREEWKRAEGAPDALRFWEWTELYARGISAAEMGVWTRFWNLFD